MYTCKEHYIQECKHISYGCDIATTLFFLQSTASLGGGGWGALVGDSSLCYKTCCFFLITGIHFYFHARALRWMALELWSALISQLLLLLFMVN